MEIVIKYRFFRRRSQACSKSPVTHGLKEASNQLSGKRSQDYILKKNYVNVYELTENQCTGSAPDRTDSGLELFVGG